MSIRCSRGCEYSQTYSGRMVSLVDYRIACIPRRFEVGDTEYGHLLGKCSELLEVSEDMATTETLEFEKQTTICCVLVLVLVLFNQLRRNDAPAATPHARTT
jgi:hypothetical protein